MMNLEKKLYSTNSFIDLEPMIENIEDDISFWGRRYVYIKSERETFFIDILAKRIMELMKQAEFEYTDEVRAAGQKIVAKINKIYSDNDKKLEGKWFITRFLCYVIDNTRRFSKNSPFFYWDIENSNKFNYYTARQYQDKFNNKPERQCGSELVNDEFIELYFPPKDLQV